MKNFFSILFMTMFMVLGYGRTYVHEVSVYEGTTLVDSFSMFSHRKGSADKLGEERQITYVNAVGVETSKWFGTNQRVEIRTLRVHKSKGMKFSFKVMGENGKPLDAQIHFLDALGNSYEISSNNGVVKVVLPNGFRATNLAISADGYATKTYNVGRYVPNIFVLHNVK